MLTQQKKYNTMKINNINAKNNITQNELDYVLEVINKIECKENKLKPYLDKVVFNLYGNSVKCLHNILLSPNRCLLPLFKGNGILHKRMKALIECGLEYDPQDEKDFYYEQLNKTVKLKMDNCPDDNEIITNPQDFEKELALDIKEVPGLLWNNCFKNAVAPPINLLGFYKPAQDKNQKPEIGICIDYLYAYEKDPEKRKQILAINIIHQLAHAMMNLEARKRKINGYSIIYDMIEEGFANYITYTHFLNQKNIEFVEHFIANQPPIFKLGLWFYEYTGDWKLWSDYKDRNNYLKSILRTISRPDKTSYMYDIFIYLNNLFCWDSIYENKELELVCIGIPPSENIIMFYEEKDE